MIKKVWAIALLLLCSCSPKEQLWNDMDVYNMAVKVDKNIKVVLPKDMESGVKCSSYREGCLGGRQAMVKGILVTIVKFDSVEHAKAAAFHIGQYWANNYVFDDVTDEPVLEKFVSKAFNAKRVKFITQE